MVDCRQRKLSADGGWGSHRRRGNAGRSAQPAHRMLAHPLSGLLAVLSCAKGYQNPQSGLAAAWPTPVGGRRRLAHRQTRANLVAEPSAPLLATTSTMDRSHGEFMSSQRRQKESAGPEVKLAAAGRQGGVQACVSKAHASVRIQRQEGDIGLLGWGVLQCGENCALVRHDCWQSGYMAGKGGRGVYRNAAGLARRRSGGARVPGKCNE